MFREINRKGNALSSADAERIMKEGTNGVLAVIGDEGYPYAVPLSYVYADGKIYFHGAAEGHKLDAIAKEPRVSFCVVEQDQIIPEDFNTLYRSAIAFGKARILREETEIRAALVKIMEKYSPNHRESGIEYISSSMGHVSAVVIEVEYLTAKEGD